MKAKRWYFSLVLATILVGFTGWLGAQDAPLGPGHGHWGGPPAGGMGGPGDFHRLLHMLRTANDLDVTDEQIDQIEAVLDNARPQVEAVAEQLRTRREAWQEANDPTVFDEAEARQFADGQAALHADLMVLHMQTRAEVLSILTPEQRDAVKSIRGGMNEGFRGKRHPKRFRR